MVISYYLWFSQPVLRCSSQYPLRSVVVFAQPRLRQARGIRGGIDLSIKYNQDTFVNID